MALTEFPRNRLGCSQLPEVPEEEVANLAVSQGPVQQEFGQLAVQVGLIFEHLHQLQKVLEKLVVPAEKESKQNKTGRWQRGFIPTQQHPLLGGWTKTAFWDSRALEIAPRQDSRQLPQGLDGEGANVAIGEAKVQKFQGAQHRQLGPGAQQIEHLRQLGGQVGGGQQLSICPPGSLPKLPSLLTWATSSCLFHLVTSSRRASASGKCSWTSCRSFHTRSFSCSYSSPDPRRSRISRSCSC